MEVNWQELFRLDVPVLEIFLRGTIAYLFLFLLLRVVLKRESGGLSITDLLMVVLLADAAQNAMAGSYQSITGGLLLVSTIIFWNYALDWLGNRSETLARLLRPPPLLLVKDGRMLRKNMRRELITEDELMSQVRQSGIEDLNQVAKVFIEGDGKFSIIRKDQGEVEKPQSNPVV